MNNSMIFDVDARPTHVFPFNHSPSKATNLLSNLVGYFLLRNKEWLVSFFIEFYQGPGKFTAPLLFTGESFAEKSV